MAAESIVAALWGWTWKGALVLVLTACAARPLAAARPVWTSLLWNAAFAVLLLLPLTALLEPIGVPQWHAADELALPYEEMALTDEAANKQATPPVLSETFEGQSAGPQEAESASPWQAWLVGLYLAGVSAALLRLGIGHWRLRLLRQRAEMLDAGALEPYLKRLGVKRKISVGICDTVSAPAVVGLWRPLVLLPRQMAGLDWRQDLEHVLLHELAHVKRWDAATDLMTQVSAAFYWHLPLVYWGRRELGRVREFACDDWVRFGAGHEKVCDYAETLTRVAAGLHNRKSLRWALAMARPGGVVQRVERLLGRQPTSPRLPLQAALPVLVLFLFGCTVIGRLGATETKTGPVKLSGIIANAPAAALPYRYERGIVPIGPVKGEAHLLPGGAFSLTLRLERPKLVRLGYDDGIMMYLFLQPGDDLHIEADWADGAARFSGSAAEDSRFLHEMVARFGVNTSAEVRGLKAEPFREAVDQRRREMTAFLQEGKGRYALTPALVDFVEASIAYGWAHDLLAYPFGNKYRDSFAANEFAASFWNQLEPVAPAAINSPYYYGFVDKYMFRLTHKQDRHRSSADNSARAWHFAEFYDRAPRHLEGRVLYWYRAGQVVRGLSLAKNPSRVPELLLQLTGQTDEERRQEAWGLALERYADFKNNNPYPEYERDVDWVFEQLREL